MDRILSVKNPGIKEVVLLRESKHRREKGLFIIEGLRELKIGLSAGITIKRIYFCPELLKDTHRAGLAASFGKVGADILETSERVYSKIAFGDRREGLIAVAVQPDLSLSGIRLNGNPLLIVATGIEKPGNLGAIARTIDAAGADALIVADARTDIYNHNAVRASLGALLAVNIASAQSGELISWLKANKINIVCAFAGTAKTYTDVDLKRPTALVFGSEKEGLGRIWEDSADCRASLPMKGEVDSLNVSVAAAVFIYEALRQRGA